MSDRIINEVTALHQFFEAWLSGSVDKSREIYKRFENAMADDFVMIPPGSNLLLRDIIMDIFWEEHGTRPSSFKNEIRDPVAREVADSLFLVSYEEWQFAGRTFQPGRFHNSLTSQSMASSTGRSSR